MAMTKQDYEKIAQVLGDYSTGDTLKAVVMIAEDLAGIFAADNPRFDRERFLRASGVA